MLPSRDEMLARVAVIPQAPVAVEAFWDGDPTGWYVVLTAIFLLVDGSGGWTSEPRL